MPQIDADKLNKYADVVFNRCNYFNDYTLETIGRRIKAIGKLSAADQQTLKNMADVSGDIKAITKKLAEITEQNVKDIEAIYTKVVSDGVDSYKPLYDFKNMRFTPFKENEFAQQLAKHWFRETAGEMINLSRTKAIGFDKYNLKGEVVGHTPLAGAFQKAIDDAVIAATTGTTDFNTAMRETVRNLGGSGVKVTYGSGVNRSLSGMIRQNLLYGAKQAAQAYDRHVGAELDCDGFEVDYHAHPRPSHAFMGGRMYAYGDAVRIGGIRYESGKDALERLEDYGCLHFKTDVILGVSEPRYDEKWLEEQKANDKKLIEYGGVKKTKYEWQQASRRIEAETRRQRDIAHMAKASGDNVLFKECSDRIKIYRDKYDDLCDSVGLEKRYNRMATYYPKDVDKAGKSGIMNGSREGEKRTAPGLSARNTQFEIPKHKKPELLEKLDKVDYNIAVKRLKDYENEIVSSDIENAIVITKKGEVWRCYGTENRVFPDSDLGDKLKGAYVTHNHPEKWTEYSFSSDDYRLFLDFEMQMLRGVDHKYIYEFNRLDLYRDKPAKSVIYLTAEDYRHEASIKNATDGGIGYWRRER